MSIVKLIPYSLLGILIFSINSSIDSNYLVRGYITLIEAQLGMVILYLFLMPKITRKI